MGNSAQSQFTEIEKKYGRPAVDYITFKSHERIAIQHTNDEVRRIYDHANLQENEDLEFLNQEKRKLKNAFEEAKQEAENTRKGSVQQSEARTKQSVQQFSGYNAEIKKLETLQKQIKERYAAERAKIQGKVDEELKKVPNKSSLKQLQEYDSKSDTQRKSIEDECLKKYPSKTNQFNTVELERNLVWDNFKGNFLNILDRNQVSKDVDTGIDYVKNNIVPSKAPLCC